MFSSHTTLWSVGMATRDEDFMWNIELIFLYRHFIPSLKFCWTIFPNLTFSVVHCYGGSLGRSAVWCSHISHVTPHSLRVMDVMNSIPQFLDPLCKKCELHTNSKYLFILPKRVCYQPRVLCSFLPQVCQGILALHQGQLFSISLCI